MLTCSLLAGCSSSSSSPGPPAPGIVSGRVVTGSGPVADAQVSIEGLVARTSRSGKFAIAEVPPGRHLVRAEAEGIPPAEVLVDVDGDTVVDVGMLEPLELVVSDAAPGSISLAWGAVASEGFGSYRLFRDEVGDVRPDRSTLVFESDDPNATFFRDEGVARDGGALIYYYRVFAAADCGTAASRNVVAQSRMWDEDDFSLRVELETSGQVPAAANATGITWDGEHVWLAHHKELGGFSDPDEVWVVELAPDGSELRRLDMSDHFSPVAGLTWFGEHLWVAWSSGSGEDLIQELDPATGEVLRTFAVPQGTVDLDQDGTHILVLNMWNELYRVDPADGSLDATFSLPFTSSTMTGVAQQGGRIWLSAWAHDQLAILDLEGNQIGSAVGKYRQIGSGRRGGALAFIGDRLAQGTRARFVLQDLVEVEP